MVAALPGGRSSRARVARRLGWCLLLLLVGTAHMWLTAQLPESHFGDGADEDVPRAIEVAFVRELAPTTPPVHAASPPAPRRVARVVRRPEPAASAASQPLPASAPASQPMAVAEAPPEPASAASAPPPVAAVEVAAAADPVASTPAPSAVAFDWPPSTRLNYDFNGNYRGPIVGNAKVEWLREGSRYQVRLEVRVPPWGGRKMVSEGLLGPDGLAPQRYVETTDKIFSEPTSQTVRMEGDRIVLANQRVNDRTPGVQDTASQFVQMTWLFLTHPEMLQVGKTVEFPLALPRRLGRWTYDVREPVTLYLPFGEVEAYHLQPRPASKRGNEWLVDMWIAPSLQYLPARIVLRQDADNYGELTLNSRPLQAAPPGAVSPAASSPGR